ncbi:hypothetical protein [Xenorhabdus bovienii]|nr:hypothetical protein [Xenorhabdus bovienii]
MKRQKQKGRHRSTALQSRRYDRPVTTMYRQSARRFRQQKQARCKRKPA